MSETPPNNSVDLARSRRLEFLRDKVKKNETLTAGEMKELERLEAAKNLPTGTVKTEPEVARFFAVTVRTVQNWKRDGMPVEPGETYNLEKIAAWREENISKKTAHDAAGTDWQQEFHKIKTLRAQLEYQRELGELVPIAEVNARMIEKIQTVKKALLALPARLAPQLVGLPVLESERIIKARIEEIVNDFAKGGDGMIEPETPRA